MNNQRIKEIQNNVESITFRDISTYSASRFALFGGRYYYDTKFTKLQKGGPFWKVSYDAFYGYEPKVCPNCGKFCNHEMKLNESNGVNPPETVYLCGPPEVISTEEVTRRLNLLLTQYDVPNDEYVILVRQYLSPDEDDLRTTDAVEPFKYITAVDKYSCSTAYEYHNRVIHGPTMIKDDGIHVYDKNKVFIISLNGNEYVEQIVGKDITKERYEKEKEECEITFSVVLRSK